MSSVSLTLSYRDNDGMTKIFVTVTKATVRMIKILSTSSYNTIRVCDELSLR